LLTKLRIRHFKRFSECEIELGRPVVFVGPNNSGKTTALQALALWETGLRAWIAKRGGDRASPEKRPGVTINRRDLTQVPVPVANLLWHDRSVRRGFRDAEKRRTLNVRIDVGVEGVGVSPWACGFEFDYANEESLVCRPLRLDGFETDRVENVRFQEVPAEAQGTRVALLPPMSGLVATEPKLERGRINVLIGEGQTAQVIRNLCWQVFDSDPKRVAWDRIKREMRDLFGMDLADPTYLLEYGEIEMAYRDHRRISFDLSSAGRGALQTLLLVTYIQANPNSVLLLDEPDAHLEILRQRQVFHLVSDLAEQTGSQIVAATHSEVVLNEAAGRGRVVAFVGRPHVVNDQGSQVRKALSDIGWDDFLQAEQRGWVLYLEGTTDLAVLKAFATVLGHEARNILSRVFLHTVASNLPGKARFHFHGLREAKRDLIGISVFDRLDLPHGAHPDLAEIVWSRREIENYFCIPAVFLRFAESGLSDDLFGTAEKRRRREAMSSAIDDVVLALQKLDKPDPWSSECKVSDDFVAPLLKEYAKRAGLPTLVKKADFHAIASLIRPEEIDQEVVTVLDRIVETAKRAKGAEDS